MLRRFSYAWQYGLRRLRGQPLRYSDIEKSTSLEPAALLKNKVVLVTGGVGILGSAISERTALAGAQVAVHYHQREKEATRLVETLQGLGRKAFAVSADIRSRPSVDRMVQSVTEHFGPIDVLVNNASTVPSLENVKDFLDHSWTDYQAYIDTALMGTFHCCQAVLPSMVERKSGRIINIGTAALDTANAHLSPYVTAKAGLLGMTRSMAQAFGPHHITVNQVVPGYLWNEDRIPYKEEIRDIRKASPLGDGLARPCDVAHVVVFLASDLAAMVTGAYLPVCAGQVMNG